MSTIYLDNLATTRCDPRVVEAMLPYFSEHYGNAASTTHALGWQAEAAVEHARSQIANAIGGAQNEVVFVSGATEANNLAIRGVAHAYAKKGRHLVVAATEHLSVLDAVERLVREGWEASVVDVDAQGVVQAEALVAAIRPDTCLVSIMLVNNEIGVIQDVPGLAAAVKETRPDIVFHCDGAQALGKIPINVSVLGVDLLSVSGHKVYGPKGIGALWRRRRPRLAITPMIEGGGHEWGLRSGTLPVPLIVGFGTACALVESELESDRHRISVLRNLFLEHLSRELPELIIHGHPEQNIAGAINIAIPGVDAATLISDVRSVAMSTGSACSSATAKPSHVLGAIAAPDIANASIRIGIGRFNTREEMERAASSIATAAKEIRG